MPAFSLSLSLSALVTALAIHAAPSLKRDNHECASLHISIDGDTCDTLGVEYGLSSSTISNANTFLEYVYFPLSVLCSLTHIHVAAAISGQEPTFVSHCLFSVWGSSSNSKEHH